MMFKNKSGGDGGVPRLSKVEELILRLLIGSGRELYGLEMVNASEGLLKRGTIYVTLSRMEDKGYITSRKEEVEINGVSQVVPRRLYKPTGFGSKAYAAWEMMANHFSGAFV